MLILIVSSAFAQDAVDTTRTDTIATPPTPPAPVTVDTLLFVPPGNAAQATEVAIPVDFEKHLTQPPTAALFKSMFVPGLGQLGNRKYFKAALFAGLEGWMLYKTLSLGSEIDDARAAYDAATTVSVRRVAYAEYDSKRKSRNKYAWFCGLTVFISMFDAYVDAHLSGSPADRRNDKFTFDVQPGEDGGAMALVSYGF